MESLARSDLYYFAAALLKAGVMMGLLPALVLACCYEVYFGRRLGKVIPFPKPKFWRRRADREVRRKVA